MNALFFERFIALRYSRSHAGGGMSSFLSTVSVLGLALSVMSLIIVMSVMNGFEGELKSRMLRLLPFSQLSIASHSSDTSDESLATASEQLRDKLNVLDTVSSTERYVEGLVMLNQQQQVEAATLLGIEINQSIYRDKLSEHLIAGDLDQLRDQPYSAVIGRLLAQQLSVTVGDSIEVVVPRIFTTPLGPRTRSRSLTVIGVFEAAQKLIRRCYLPISILRADC